MEKQTPLERSPSGEKPEMLDNKGEEVPAAAQDVVLGQMLEVHATPEEERKVLWKLDLM